MIDWHHLPLIAPLLQTADEVVEAKRIRFTAQDVWSFVAAAATVSALYWGLANKLDTIAHLNDQKIDRLEAQNAETLKKLEKLEVLWQAHADESSRMRERMSKTEQQLLDHERDDVKRFGR